MKRILVVALIASLSGCSMFAKKPDPAFNKTLSSKSRSQQLNSLRYWNVSGAISLRHQNKTDIGSFNWAQKNKYYDFKTYGPLNLAGIRIEGQPGRVTLWKNTKDPRYAQTPEELMSKELGWYLPLSSFLYWGRAIPAPGIPSEKTYDKYGHLSTLQQQGWSIQFTKYQGVSGMDLPRTMILDHQNLHAKIVFKRWQIPTN